MTKYGFRVQCLVFSTEQRTMDDGHGPFLPHEGYMVLDVALNILKNTSLGDCFPFLDNITVSISFPA